MHLNRAVFDKITTSRAHNTTTTLNNVVSTVVVLQSSLIGIGVLSLTILSHRHRQRLQLVYLHLTVEGTTKQQCRQTRGENSSSFER